MKRHSLQPILSRPNQKKATIKKLFLATAIILPFTTACTGDDVGEVRVIEDKKAEEKENVSVKASATTALNNAVLNVYDLTNKQDLINVKFKQTPNFNSKKKADITLVDKGLEAVDRVKETKLQKNATILATLSANTNNSTDSSTGSSTESAATYYDPILDKVVALPKDQALMAIANTSATKEFSLLKPTPITTLAIYRSLARVGWFFDHDALPTNAELADIIKENSNFIYFYNTAIFELGNTLALTAIDLQAIYNKSSLVEMATPISSTNIKASNEITNWLALLAQMHIYQDKYQSKTPFFSFAHDMAQDFYDGDIDGATYNSLGKDGGFILVNSLVPNTANAYYDSLVDGIYEAQKPLLINFEQQIYNQLSKINADLVSKAPKEKQTDIKTALDQVLTKYTTNDITEGRNSQKTANAITSYADFQFPGAITHFYRGIGNQTAIFGLDKSINSLNNLNVDENKKNKNLFIENLAGKYVSNACVLTILDTGIIHLSSKNQTTANNKDGAKSSNGYQVIIDRELQDTLYRVGSGNNYVLNVSSKTEKGRRFVQLNITDQTITSASTAMASSANADKLSNPDLSCEF